MPRCPAIRVGVGGQISLGADHDAALRALDRGVFFGRESAFIEAADQPGYVPQGAGESGIIRQLAPGYVGLDRDVLADWAFGVLIVGDRRHGRRSPSRRRVAPVFRRNRDAIRCCTRAETPLRYCLVWPINSLPPFVALLTVLTPAKAAVPTRGATLN